MEPQGDRRSQSESLVSGTKFDRCTFVAAAATLVAALTYAQMAIAQPATNVPRVAIVHHAVSVANMSEAGNSRLFADLLSGLRDVGYVEGETITIDRWSGEGQTEEGLSRMVDDVIESKPDIIVVGGRRLNPAFMAATKTIPIVASDGFPADINFGRPGGNISGVSPSVGGLLYAKRLQLLHDLVPTASRIAFLGPRPWWENETQGGAVRQGAEQLGLTLVPFLLEFPVTEAAIRLAIASIDETSIGAIFVSGGMSGHDATLADAITAKQLPSNGRVGAVRKGLLMCYRTGNAELSKLHNRLAIYVDRILKGANPGDLPIEQPTVFELTINLKTAREFGITIPPAIMIQATEFIE